jgi:hypothetical protein
MRKALTNLVKVKTIITLAVTGAMIYGFVKGKISTELFMPIVTMILTYYFTKKEESQIKEGDE